MIPAWLFKGGGTGSPKQSWGRPKGKEEPPKASGDTKGTSVTQEKLLFHEGKASPLEVQHWQ